MSSTQKRKAIADWQVKSEQVKEARNKRGISATTHRISVLGMYAEPRDRDSIPGAKQAAWLERERAGGDSSSRATETTTIGAGSDPCAPVVDSRAGGDASRTQNDVIPMMLVFRDRVSCDDHREKREPRSPVCVAKGIAIREAKKIPKA